jgi:voltage-gated potassium channel
VIIGATVYVLGPCDAPLMLQPRRRFHVVSGMVLPLVALIRMVRDPQGRAPVLLVLSLFIIGTAFYWSVEDWSVIDSFYFSTMTLATVGFGDLAPTTDASKLFTVFYVLGGVGILVTFFSELTRWSLELRAQLRGEDTGPR